MRVRAALFDMDGTILDSAGKTGVNRFFEVARRCGLAAEKRRRKQVLERWGTTADSLFNLCWPTGDFQEFHREWQAMDIETPPPLIRGATSVIETLSAARIMLGILSNRSGATIANLLETYRLAQFFSIFYTRDTLPQGAKTNPWSIRIVLDDLEGIRGIRKKEVIFVGDSDIDLRWSRWAGLCFIAVCTGNVPRREFLDAGHPEPLVLDSIASVPECMQMLEHEK